MERFQKAKESNRYETALRLLNEISGIILENRDHSSVLNRIITKVARVFNARAGSIAVPDDNGTHMKFVAGFNRNPELLERLNTSHRLKIDEGVAGRAFSNEEITLVSDVFDDNIFKEKFYEHANREDFKAVFAIPLIAFDTCIGVASLYFQNKREFDSSLRDIMQPVSNQIAIAMLQSDLIQDLEQSKSRLKKQAETDGLTGLSNQKKIRHRLQSELDRSDRYDIPVSIIMADIDRFKSINDQYGHLVGDAVLESLADHFLQEKREIDAVGRYGGEEFLFVLPETGEEKAKVFADRIRRSVEDLTIEEGEHSVQLTISLGVASNKDETEFSDEIIAQADSALLTAKQTGRNMTVPYSDLSDKETNDNMPERPIPSSV